MIILASARVIGIDRAASPAYNKNMKGTCLVIAYAMLVGGGAGAIGAAQAADVAMAAPVEEYYKQLEEDLSEQIGLLDKARDKATADAACPALSRNLSRLEELTGKAQKAEFWRYIDNTPDVKQNLVERVQRLSLQLQRLEKVECYGSEGMKKLLAPLLNPAATPQAAP